MSWPKYVQNKDFNSNVVQLIGLHKSLLDVFKLVKTIRKGLEYTTYVLPELCSWQRLFFVGIVLIGGF